MENIFIPTSTFEKSYKRLKKKYHSLKTDIEEFKREYNENPHIRLTSSVFEERVAGVLQPAYNQW